MKKKMTIPDSYFDNQEFTVDKINEKFALGILGKKPSADQILKFELCTFISNLIDKKGLSLADVEKITGINPSEISRIKNHHLGRFTIDRLVRIYSSLDSLRGVGDALRFIGLKIGKQSA